MMEVAEHLLQYKAREKPHPKIRKRHFFLLLSLEVQMNVTSVVSERSLMH